MTFKVPENLRDLDATDESYGNNGLFSIVIGQGIGQVNLKVVASDGGEWEHVSVSTIKRCPTWDEMCFVKSLFWDDEDCVVQYHPPKSNYKNVHPYVLHLWRPIKEKIPIPPIQFV